MPERRIRVGTRTSKLAQTQTGMAVDALRKANPAVEFTLVGMTTQGDRDHTQRIANLGQGVFTKELENALQEGRIDLAVHSLKDMTTELPPGLLLAGVLQREDPRDVLVSRDRKTLPQLPKGARVGTGSPRRAAQVLSQRPDLQIVLIRGNVDTRVAKALETNEVDAVVLAAAGLSRLGRMDVIAEYFDPLVFLPAIGQGFLALESRAEDAETRAIVARVEDPAARKAADAERAFLASIGGGCNAPVGAYALYKGTQVSMAAVVVSPDGKTVLRAKVEGDLAPQAAALGIRERLYAQGAERIIQEAEAAHG